MCVGAEKEALDVSYQRSRIPGPLSSKHSDRWQNGDMLRGLVSWSKSKAPLIGFLQLSLVVGMTCNSHRGMKVADQMLSALVSLRVTVLELEGESRSLTLEMKTKTQRRNVCAQGHTAIQNSSLNLSLGVRE